MKKYSSLTLIEMLIVMAILAVFLAMILRLWTRLQDANAVNEVTMTITQDIRAAQRSAMMLERRSDERWLYGIGIDFRDITDSDNPRYTVFKFCSAEDVFDRNNFSHTSSVPANRLTGGVLNRLRGPSTDCSRGGAGSVARSDIRTRSFEDFYYLDFTLYSSEYILFQSVTGKAFLYQESGASVVLNNYSGSAATSSSLDTFNLVSPNNVVPFRLGIDGNVGPEKEIRVYPVSGIMFVENLILR